MHLQVAFLPWCEQACIAVFAGYPVRCLACDREWPGAYVQGLVIQNISQCPARAATKSEDRLRAFLEKARKAKGRI